MHLESTYDWHAISLEVMTNYDYSQHKCQNILEQELKAQTTSIPLYQFCIQLYFLPSELMQSMIKTSQKFQNCAHYRYRKSNHKRLELHQSNSCLLLLLFIFALNFDFAMSVWTVFRKFPAAINTKRIPQNITWQKTVFDY